MVGTGRGAQLGILIKGPEVLEQTRRIDDDRARQDRHDHRGADGARRGRPLNGATRADILRLAGAVEAAASIRSRRRSRCGEGRGRRAPRRRELPQRPGVGVLGGVEGHSVEVGRARRRRDRRLGRCPARDAGRPRHGQADERRGSRRAASGSARAGAAHGRRARDCGAGRGRGRHRACPGGGLSGGQGGRDRAPAGGGRGRGDGRRRRERRAGARTGRPRPGDRHGHGRRDRGVRPDPRLGRPARGRRRDPARAPDAPHDQGQSLLGLRLQRRRHPAGRRRAARPDRRRRRDGVLQPVRRHQQPAPPALPQRREEAT